MKPLPIYYTVQMMNGDKNGPLMHCATKVKGDMIEKWMWCYTSNSSVASVGTAWFLTPPYVVFSNDTVGSCWPRDVKHLILMTSKFPSTKCLWLRARVLYRVRVSDGESRGERGLQGGRGKKEDICNTNRSLSLPLHHWPGRTPGAACPPR